MCTTCLPRAPGDQNRALDPWELELQMLWLPLGCGNPSLSQNQLMLLTTEPAVQRRWEVLCSVFEITQCNGKEQSCVFYNGQQRDCFIEILLQSKRINKSKNNSKF